MGRRGTRRSRSRRCRATALTAVAVVTLGLSSPASIAADEGTDAYCQAFEGYVDAVRAVGNDDAADVTPALRAFAAAGLAVLDDLPDEVATGNLDASVEFCGLDTAAPIAPDREGLARYLVDVVGATEDEAGCLADGLTSEFDDDALVTIRFGGLRDLSDGDTDRYLRLVTACLADPALASTAVEPSPAAPTPLTGVEQQAREESAEVLDHRQFASFTGWTVADHEGAAVTVEDGERVSTPSPADAADPVHVWFLGGNALFGPAQRDAATVASQVAAGGALAGRPLAVRNLGLPGFSDYQETIVLADQLAQGERPDVAVFYDGFEDLELALGSRFAGLRFRDGADHRQAATFADVIAAARGRSAVTDGGGLLARIDVGLDAADAVAAAAEDLAGAMSLSEVLASTYGIQVVHLWVPTIHTKALLPAEAALLPGLGLGGGRAGVWRTLAADLRRQLPDSVVDLSGALDTTAVPVLVDGSSTTEAGAGVMAQAVGSALTPALATAEGTP